VAAYPIGDPREASVRIVDRQGFGSAEELYAHAFGADADRTNLHGGRSGEMVASLLGHEPDEIVLYGPSASQVRVMRCSHSG
jgi:hypothetical protein